MLALMADQKTQFKVDLDKELVVKIKRVFSAQGVSVQEGTKRLFWFVSHMPEELYPIFFAQLRGDSAKDVVLVLLQALAKPAKGKRHRRRGVISVGERVLELPLPPIEESGR